MCHGVMPTLNGTSTREQPYRITPCAITFVNYDYTIKLYNILGRYIYIYRLLLLLFHLWPANRLTIKNVALVLTNFGHVL